MNDLQKVLDSLDEAGKAVLKPILAMAGADLSKAGEVRASVVVYIRANWQALCGVGGVCLALGVIVGHLI